MKLTKAIEILDLNIKETGKKMPPDCKDAVQLGIEAIKRLRTRRGFSIPADLKSLPGETPEN